MKLPFTFYKIIKISVFVISFIAADLLMAVESGRQVQDSKIPQVSSQGRSRSERKVQGVYKTRIEPHWFVLKAPDGAEDTCFWYRNDLADGERQFIMVDVLKELREDAFDHKRLAEALKDAGLEDISAESLPLERLEFVPEKNDLKFRVEDNDWRCNLLTYELEKIESQETTEQNRLSIPNVPRASTRTGPETSITFVNRTKGQVELFWLDGGGRRNNYGTLAAGDERDQHTYAGHVWEVVDSEGNLIAAFEAEESNMRAVISGRNRYNRQSRERVRDRFRQSRRIGDESPDGKWTAFVKDDNVYIRSKDDDTEIQLSQDGSSTNSYRMPQWAPDSESIIAWRCEPGDHKEVYLIETSPPGGGRALLHSRPYDLPGDKFDAFELNIFNISDKRQIKPELERIDLDSPHPRWNKDGYHFTYEKVDRGHQRFRVIEVNTHDGSSHNIIDEKSETFIWTAHTENLDLSRVNYLDETDEIIYVSEMDGWRHLYLIDAGTGKIKNKITDGQWLVRGVQDIDKENRQIWFSAGSFYPDQDPYFVHYFRVNFDGTGLVALTEANGNHSIQYSPDKEYIIDTYSRVDMAPVHELRRTSDGRLVFEFEKADIGELIAEGWEAPEVFVAKGRDGETDIWGIISRPNDLELNKKYPVIEDIYAGPQSAFTPKSFSAYDRYKSLNDLGFIVVKMDGMGTANRSKAFHDVCWKNLKDAGFPDRILWHQAAAKKYSYYDIDRVGVYGVSAGAQSAAGAVLFHPEFYKVAAAFCGCHDNRMDKASWNEQWMGYPVGPQYSECSNIDNAYRLQGKLFLMVGEMDNNVPPESTMRFVDALIKAEKDFELLVIPGGGHGMGSSYGQRRMEDFFIRHLLNVDAVID